MPIARHLVERGCGVTGVDAAERHDRQVCGRFPENEWHVADMRTLALNRTFDGIIAWDSFFHLSQPDQRLMFPIFERHAAAGPR